MKDQKQGIFELFDQMPGRTVGLAVSGGGDSMALAAIACEWASKTGRRLSAVTIDHQLRPESAEEAQRVASFCAEIGLPHTVLVWGDWDGHGNLQDEARKARIRMIKEWALEHSIRSVATGHTLDDQAETVLMRLARGSGVDGLSGIPQFRSEGNITWVRPLLNMRRDHLRDYLAKEGLPWIEDPSNEDDRFDRVRARKMLDELADLGLTREKLSETATRMTRVRAALEIEVESAIANFVRADHGDAVVDWARVSQLPDEIRNRTLIRVLRWISGSVYPPRESGLAGLIATMEVGQTSALSGCLVTAEGTKRRFTREANAVSTTVCGLDSHWDGRWQLAGPATPGAEIRFLGENGIRDCGGWREAGLPRVSLIASPSVWVGSRIIAAPLAGFGRHWSAKLVAGREKI